MIEVDPLTAEEILFIRAVMRRRKWVLTGIWTALGGALAAAAWAALTTQ